MVSKFCMALVVGFMAVVPSALYAMDATNKQKTVCSTVVLCDNQKFELFRKEFAKTVQQPNNKCLWPSFDENFVTDLNDLTDKKKVDTDLKK